MTTQPTKALPKPKPEPLKTWQAKFEVFLLIEGRKRTRDRYAVALERFRSHFPNKIYPHDFLRPDINDYVAQRLTDGASPATVEVELAAIRAFWDFMIRLEVFGAFFNPATGVSAAKTAKTRAAAGSKQVSLKNPVS